MNGFGFSPVEALLLGVPVILTKCPVFDEIGIKDKVHGFLLDFNMNNVPVEEICKGLPKFKYTPPKDNWNNLLFYGKSNYKEQINQLEELEIIKDFSFRRFNEINKIIRNNPLKNIDGHLFEKDIIICNKILADYFMGNNELGKIVAKPRKENK